MTNTSWAQWLQEAMDERGWTQAEFVRQSGGHIKADRISKWLSGKEVASHKFAIIAANTLGKPHAESLRAAGFIDRADEMERRRSALDAQLGIDTTNEGRLIESLKSVPDSTLLRVLQLRAEAREANRVHPIGVAGGNITSLDRFVRGKGDTAELTQRDHDRVAWEDDGDTGEDLDQ